MFPELASRQTRGPGFLFERYLPKGGGGGMPPAALTRRLLDNTLPTRMAPPLQRNCSIVPKSPVVMYP